MAIKFLKDHCGYKVGDVVNNHPNEAYLITLKVAEYAKVNSVKQENNEAKKVKSK